MHAPSKISEQLDLAGHDCKSLSCLRCKSERSVRTSRPLPGISSFFCKCVSEWVTRAASSAYSSSRSCPPLVLVFPQPEKVEQPAVVTTVEHDSDLHWESVGEKSWRMMSNSVGAMTQPCLTPLQARKIIDIGTVKLECCLYVFVERWKNGK